MKKIAFYLMLFIGVVMNFSLASCGSDDEELTSIKSESSLIGTWSRNKAATGAASTVLYTLTFASNGTYLATATPVGDYVYSTTKETGKYTLDTSKNTITFTPEDEDTAPYTLSIYMSGNKLKIGDGYFEKK